MVKFAHLLVLSVLVVWVAVSGYVGNNASEVKESKISQDLADVQNSVPAEDLETSSTQAEIQELDSEISDLENLLENISPEEEIVIEKL